MGSRHHNSHLRTGQQKPETLPLLSWEAHSIQPPLLPESEFHLVPTMSPVSFKWKTGYNWRGWSMSDTFTRAAKEWGKGVSWDGTNHMGNSSDIDRKWGLSFVCLFLTYVFIYLLAVVSLHDAGGLSLLVASGGSSLLECAGFLLQWFLLLQSTGSRVLGLQQLWCVGSIVVAHGYGWSLACGILPDQESNQCPPHWLECRGHLEATNHDKCQFLLLTEIRKSGERVFLLRVRKCWKIEFGGENSMEYSTEYI